MRLSFYILLFSIYSHSQNTFTIEGRVTSNGQSLPYVNIYIENIAYGSATNEDGTYSISNLTAGSYSMYASFTGYKTVKRIVEITNENLVINFNLEETESLNE